jgi:hypothetical protein
MLMRKRKGRHPLKLFCPNCAEAVIKSDIYCPNCGFKIDGAFAIEKKDDIVTRSILIALIISLLLITPVVGRLYF